MLKKGDWHESVRELVINHGHDLSGQPEKKRDHELERRSSQRRSSNARQLGCVFHDMKSPRSYLTEELRHAETNPSCEIHESYCTSH